MTYKIILSFDNPEDALAALLHLGDADAPVFLGDEATNSTDFPRVEIGDAVYPLWAGYRHALDDLRAEARK